MSFDANLQRGKIAESKIARWLRLRGWTIIPVYEIEKGHGKGPQIYSPAEEIVAPDLLGWKDGRFRFIEAKNKSVFTRRRSGTPRWQTGIDRRHYEHYLKAAAYFNLEVWLMFLHESNVPSAIDLKYPDCPPECPVGLFGESIERLNRTVDHTDARWGASGMVYWNKDSLRLICCLEDLTKTSRFDSEIFEHSVLSGTQASLPFNCS